MPLCAGRGAERSTGLNVKRVHQDKKVNGLWLQRHAGGAKMRRDEGTGGGSRAQHALVLGRAGDCGGEWRAVSTGTEVWFSVISCGDAG